MNGDSHLGERRIEGDFEGAAASFAGEVPVDAIGDRSEGSWRANIQGVAGGQGADSTCDLVGIDARWKPDSYFSQSRDVLSGAAPPRRAAWQFFTVFSLHTAAGRVSGWLRSHAQPFARHNCAQSRRRPSSGRRLEQYSNEGNKRHRRGIQSGRLSSRGQAGRQHHQPTDLAARVSRPDHSQRGGPATVSGIHRK
jgi:hypothetical protein